MRLDPKDPFDVYFALRLTFVDRPDVRIRLQDRAASPGSSRFAPDPALWPVDAYACFDPDDECCLAPTDVDLPCSPRCPRIADPTLYESKLVQAGSLDREVQEAGVGASAFLARALWETQGAGMAAIPVRRDRWPEAQRFAAEVLLGETGS